MNKIKMAYALTSEMNHPEWHTIAKRMLDWTQEDTGIQPSTKLQYLWKSRLEELNKLVEKIIRDEIADRILTELNQPLGEVPKQNYAYRSRQWGVLATCLLEWMQQDKGFADKEALDEAWNKRLRVMFRTVQELLRETAEQSSLASKSDEGQRQSAVPALHSEIHTQE